LNSAQNTPVLPKLNVHTRTDFARNGVRENGLTTPILDSIFPFFPAECSCITAYLDYTDQYWPVNYHWDFFIHTVDRFITVNSVPESLRGSARSVRAQLMSNPPDPVSGYRNDASAGATKDRSSPERIEARFTQVRRAKLDFEGILLKSGLIDATKKANPSPDARTWWSVLGPVPAPKGSKHGTGYALDIEGPSAEIVRISTVLGATSAYAEASHTHVEWSEGVRLSVRHTA
jgi:hypothetical protein